MRLHATNRERSGSIRLRVGKVPEMDRRFIEVYVSSCGGRCLVFQTCKIIRFVLVFGGSGRAVAIKERAAREDEERTKAFFRKILLSAGMALDAFPVFEPISAAAAANRVPEASPDRTARHLADIERQRSIGNLQCSASTNNADLSAKRLIHRQVGRRV